MTNSHQIWADSGVQLGECLSGSLMITEPAQNKSGPTDQISRGVAIVISQETTETLPAIDRTDSLADFVTRCSGPPNFPSAEASSHSLRRRFRQPRLRLPMECNPQCHRDFRFGRVFLLHARFLSQSSQSPAPHLSGSGTGQPRIQRMKQADSRGGAIGLLPS